MMGSAETRPLLDEFSPLVERKSRSNGVWGARAKYALATLALVGVAAFAGVAVFPGDANNIAALGDKADFVAEAPTHHRSSSAKYDSRHYVPRGSARLGEDAAGAVSAPAAEGPAPKEAHPEKETVESSAADAEIAQLKAEKSQLESALADANVQIATLTADTSAHDALKKCQDDMHDVQKEKTTIADELDRLEAEIADEREAHMKVGGFNCGRVIPGEDRDEKLAECDKEMRIQLYERKKANQRKYQMRLQNDALHAEIEGLENKLLELDGEIRMCIADSAAAAQEASVQLADANTRTEDVRVEMASVEYELEVCMNGKKVCDTKVHDMEGELKDMEAREDKCEEDFAHASKMFQDSHASKDEATKQLQSDIDRLTLDNKNVKDKRDSLEKELNEKFVEINTLEESVKKNQAAAEEANNAKFACNAENSMISASIDHLKNDAKRMERTLNMTRDSKLAMVDEVMRLNSKMEELEGEILEADNKLKAAVNTSAAEKQELIGKAMEKDEQIASVKTEIASLKADLNVSSTAELSLQKRLADAQEKAAAAQKDLEGQVTQCQSDAAAARDAFNEKHADNSEMSQQLKDQIKQLEAQMAEAAESCKKGKAECVSEIAALHDDINAKQAEVQAALAQVDAKAADIDVCYAATDKLHTENAALIGSVDQMSSDIKTMANARALCESTKNGILEDNKKCEASVEKCEADGAAEREVLLKKHADKNEITQQLNADLTRIQGEVAKCVEAKTAANAQVDACTSDIDDAKKETNQIKADMTELKTQPWCKPPMPASPPVPTPTMAEGLFMFMGGESGKSCADEGSRFICNRGHIGSWERNTFAYPTREQMNQVSGLKPNMVSIKGGQRGTYCYTQNLDMKCGSGSPNTLAHWFTVGGADPVKADWTGGGFGSADKKFDYFISLKSNEAGGAFCNDARGSSTIKCDKPTVGKGETFHMLWLSTEESKSADEKAAAEKIAINSAPAPPPSPASPPVLTPTMAEGLFMFMGGESGKSCADEGSRFICNRGHIGSWERNTFAYPTREQMNQVSGLKPNMVSIKGGQRGTYCYTQNLDMKCGSGSPNTLAHWFTVGGADPVKADWTGGGFGSADKKFDYFISLKSNEAGGAFCNDARGSSTIKCDKPTVGKGETFHMLWLSTEESKSADEKAAAEKIAINSAPAPPPSTAKPSFKPNWSQISGKLKQVSVDGDTVCGVNAHDHIYCKDSLSDGSWRKLPGGLKYVSVSGGKLYGVNRNDDIYYSPNTQGQWTRIPGKLKQVDLDGDTVCGVNAHDHIYCKDSLTGGSWRKLPGGLKHVSVSGGKLYGVNRNDDIYYSPNTQGQWTHIPGKLKQVDLDGDTVCGVNSADNIYCKDSLTGRDWTRLSGGLKHISVSGGVLYGVNSKDDIYSDEKAVSVNVAINSAPAPPPSTAKPSFKPDWSQISGKLKQVSVDGDTVCGVNAHDHIYCKDSLSDGSWRKLPGGLKYVSVSGGKLYGVNRNDDIYYSPNTQGQWTRIPGKLKQVDLDGDTVCGVNAHDRIYCKDSLTGGSWRKLPGGLKHVSVSGGKLYGVNRNDDIYYSPNTQGRWTRIPGKLKQVDLDGDTVCGVNSADHIFCKDSLTGRDWTRLSGGLKHISVSGGVLYGVNSKDDIYSDEKAVSVNVAIS